MRHSHVIEGHAFRLRPVEDADANFIMNLRKGQPYLNIGAQSVREQLQWQQKYYAREDEYYFVIETKACGKRVGTVGLDKFDHASSCAFWSRWAVVPESVAATESALLIMRFAFETMGLDAVRVDVIAEHMSVISFHRSCGMRELEVLPDYYRIGEMRYNAVVMEMTPQTHEHASKKLDALASPLAGRIQ